MGMQRDPNGSCIPCGWNDNYHHKPQDEMLPAAATWRCDGQHHIYIGVYAAAVDFDVGVESKGKTRSQEAILFNYHEINEDLGKLFETTVKRSNWGII
jgi:hypothetical protein